MQGHNQLIQVQQGYQRVSIEVSVEAVIIGDNLIYSFQVLEGPDIENEDFVNNKEERLPKIDVLF